jgi:hypothetical protein
MTRARTLGVLWVIGVGLSFGSLPARADVPPPGAEACDDKSAGDACEGVGTCKESTCRRADLANWDRDAEAGPPSIEYDCLLCVDKSGEPLEPGRGGSGAGGKAGAGGKGGAGGGTSTPSSDGDDSGCGCSAPGRDLGLRGAALSFALFMGMLLSTRRRKGKR